MDSGAQPIYTQTVCRELAMAHGTHMAKPQKHRTIDIAEEKVGVLLCVPSISVLPEKSMTTCQQCSECKCKADASSNIRPDPQLV